MSANPVLDMFRSQIGQVVTNSPSGLSNWLGGTLLQAEEGLLEFSFTVRADMCNPTGRVHGGVLAAISDDIMGALTFINDPQGFNPAINLSIDFISSAKLGDTIVARASMVRAGQAAFNVNCDIFGPDGRLVSRASNNLIRLKR